MTDNTLETAIPEHELIAQRRAKLAQLREQGEAFPNDFKREHRASELHQHYEQETHDSLEAKKIKVTVAGRVMMRRLMGKASFVSLQDVSGRIQLYVREDELGHDLYEAFKHWDLGDIVGAEGVLFKTKTNELSIKVNKLKLLVKSLRPLPDKHSGLSDVEARYRQRYLDLIANDTSRHTFETRSKIIAFIRAFLVNRHYLEVETPMMQAIPGGAAARPFMTHHNALDMQLFMRIAPELYLKRLVVGGFERVFEINRNFRNEGISTQHNPEFTMLEFYQAYATYHDMIEITESMLRELSQHVLGTTQVPYQEEIFDFGKPFQRMTIKESVLHFNPDLTLKQIEDIESLRAIVKKLGVTPEKNWGIGKLQIEIFEQTVEHQLRQPTFITEYPTEVSPLARRNPANPEVTDRFEFFIAGKEIANGFSELNDPEDQAERFREQVKAKDAGDLEAMYYDEDYVTSLEHGLPPTAGEGIGIDRLTMLLTNSPSIRDVILFPLMKFRANE